MGKSGGRRKKLASSSDPAPSKIDLDVSVFLRRAHELKEEGNKRFQLREYGGAMEQYEQGLKLIPKGHPDRAVFHSNRAACLMQMKPVQHENVITECTLALEVQPRFGRALFRRARAYEALGKLEFALQDAQMILQGDANHQDALELVKRLRVALGSTEEAQQDLQGRPTVNVPSRAGTSPAALGASVVRGSPVGGRGPCLPARPFPKKKGKPGSLVQATSSAAWECPLNGEVSVTSAPVETADATKVDPVVQVQRLESSLDGHLSTKVFSHEHDNASGRLEPKENLPLVKARDHAAARKKDQGETNFQTRPLKLIYDHDIRLAQLPINCKYSELREVVRKKFPSSRSVLIKYKDLEGDLVTITSTGELRLAETVVDLEAERNAITDTRVSPSEQQGRSPINTSLSLSTSAGYLPLRLHVVEVSAEQEPIVEDEDIFIDSVAEDVSQNVEEISNSSRESVEEEEVSVRQEQVHKFLNVDSKLSHSEKQEKPEGSQPDGKEFEIDEWLLEFAHLFRTHLGIDSDGHIDLHELGMELCGEALEETIKSEEAQRLFQLAACKFQEVAALAFFNWGNVHMCAARKRIPLEDASEKGEFAVLLETAFDWAQGQYALAEQKYEEALHVKADFYEGILALGQQKFESAKLRWSVAVASKVDLSTWDSSETLALFCTAEEKMQMAVEMWEKFEGQRMNEARTALSGKKKSVKPDLGFNGDPAPATAEVESAEQVVVMRSQINLFWGNILFDHSQVEFRLGLPSWKELLDSALQKFEIAGASPADIAQVLKNHVSNDSAAGESSTVKVCVHREESAGHGNTTQHVKLHEDGDVKLTCNSSFESVDNVVSTE
eukprot:c24925_g1_i1 orf=210-2735(+)